MAQTFYGVLGVGPDADAAEIRRGFRERVTEVHPDVSDDPDAEQAFKRLVAAKETLLDDAERARYDRLGHAAYVRHHADCSGWTDVPRTTVGTPTNSGAPASDSVDRRRSRTDPTGSDRSGADRTGDPNGTDRTPDPGEGSRSQTPDDTGRASRTRAASAAGSAQDVYGPYASTSVWHTRSPGGYDRAGRHPVATRLVRGLRKLGPWVLVHAIFLSLAAGTSWYVYAFVLSDSATSLPLVMALIGEIGLAVVLSTIHVISRLSR
ncbi:MAG: J domain-containing protein [Haloarculaceae archaeon]